MMDAIYIPSVKRIINLDHVTDVKYSPARDYTYEDEDDDMRVKPAHDDAWMDLVMTSVEDKIISGYDGEFQGVASVSREIRIYGKDAELLWDHLKNNIDVWVSNDLEG